MFHYGTTEQHYSNPEASFETLDAALTAAQDASMYMDDVFAVWSDDDPANPEYLCWGGTVYAA